MKHSDEHGRIRIPCIVFTHLVPMRGDPWMYFKDDDEAAFNRRYNEYKKDFASGATRHPIEMRHYFATRQAGEAWIEQYGNFIGVDFKLQQDEQGFWFINRGGKR